jgi:hypothetical protein
MKTKLMKTSVKGALVALLGSVGVFLLLVAGTQGSDPAPTVGGFQCTNGSIQGTWGTHLEGTGPVPPPPWRRDPDPGRGRAAHV